MSLLTTVITRPAIASRIVSPTLLITTVVHHLRASISVISCVTILVSILVLNVDSTVDVENSFHSPDGSFSLEELTVNLNDFKIIYFSAR